MKVKEALVNHRMVVLLSWLALASACRPRLDGAPCSSDENCPNGQVCAGGVCIVGAGAGGGRPGESDSGTGGGGGGGSGGGGGRMDGGAQQALREFVSSGGSMSGGTLSLEVGHLTPRTTMTGGTLQLTGAAVVQQ